MAYPRRDIAHACGKVDVTSTSSVAVANNPARLSLLVKNDTGGVVYLKFATATGKNLGDGPATPVAVADATSLKLADGQSFSTTDYTGPVAIIAPGSVSVTVVEF